MRGIIVNSGNANCCTKEDGYPASIATAEACAPELGGIDPSQILVCSTGVIGAPLRVEKILAAVPHVVLARSAEPGAFEEFARSIMTTDTRPKWAAAKCRVGGKQVRLLGCAKGSGMIEPNMATMLAFIATDAAIAPALLDRALRASVEPHLQFHHRGWRHLDERHRRGPRQRPLRRARNQGRSRRGLQELSSAALESICKSLALAIIEDGEGAQRTIEIEVRGAASERAARQIAKTIANSPLVKTAFAGADPNWGRILAAAGRSGVKFDLERVNISIAGVAVCRRGARASLRRARRSPENAREARPGPRRSALRQRLRPRLDLRLHHRVRPHQFQLPHLGPISRALRASRGYCSFGTSSCGARRRCLAM